jgi:hypothetical protein
MRRPEIFSIWALGSQARATKAAGATRLMLTVSLASDPVRTVELFGAHVLPKLSEE